VEGEVKKGFFQNGKELLEIGISGYLVNKRKTAHFKERRADSSGLKPFGMTNRSERFGDG
jgi:hypothetical protein